MISQKTKQNGKNEKITRIIQKVCYPSNRIPNIKTGMRKSSTKLSKKKIFQDWKMS